MYIIYFLVTDFPYMNLIFISDIGFELPFHYLEKELICAGETLFSPYACNLTKSGMEIINLRQLIYYKDQQIFFF